MLFKSIRATFYQENILVVDGDKFIEDPVPVLQSVERFLQIPSFYTDQHFTHNGNSSQCVILLICLLKGRKGYPCFKLDVDSPESCMSNAKAREHPEISSDTRDYLRKMFKTMLEEFNRKTEMNIRLS